MKVIHKKAFLLLFVIFCLTAIDIGLGMHIIPRHQFRTAHYYYHHGLLPRRNDISSWGKEKYRVFTNSLGLRDGAVREVSPIPSKRRIVFIGDSFTEGIGVPYEDTFAGMIGSRIDAEVLNTGVVGYSPKLYYLKAKYLIEEIGLKFYEAVILIDISDIVNELEYEDYKPGGVDPANKPTFAIENLLSDYSATYYLVSLLVKSHEEIAERRILTGNIPCWGMKHPEIHNNRVEALWTVDKDIYERFGKKGLVLAEENMQRLVDLLRKNNITPYIVVYPWPDQVYLNDKDSIQVRHWRNFSRKNNIKFLDLFPTFIDPERFSNPKEVYARFFIEHDVHWNPAGHGVVADKILQLLQADK